MFLMLKRTQMINNRSRAPSYASTTCNTIRNINQFFNQHDLPPIQSQLGLLQLLHPSIDILVTLHWSMVTIPYTSLNIVHLGNHGTIQDVTSEMPYCFFVHGSRVQSLIVSVISPSHNILCRIAATGVPSRMRVETKPSQAMVQCHIEWNQIYQGNQLKSTENILEQYNTMVAICVELIA